MESKAVEILNRDTVYKGYFRVDKVELRHSLFSGEMGQPILRESLDRGHAAAVLPYDPVRDEVVLIEQFRLGALEAGREPWLIEVVAGIIDPGETAEEVARRECEEEIGRPVTDLVPIMTFLPSPGAMSETIALYCGRVDAAGADGIFGLPGESEDIRAFALPRTTALDWLDQGRIDNSAIIIALQWLALNHRKLLAQWRETGTNTTSKGA